jgi:hypothetical protein
MTVPAPAPNESLFDETNGPQAPLPDFGVEALRPDDADSLFGPPRRSAARRQPARSAAPHSGPVDFTPKETRYAGCRFRSRLEARWAVFLDHLGIEWLYEPEGYEVGPPERRRGYLPDFFLPGHDIWAEVKGHAGAFDPELLLAAADPQHGLPRSLDPNEQGYGLWEPRVLLLGQVPERPSAHDLLSVVAAHFVAQHFAVVICGARSGRRHGIEPVMTPVIATADRLREGALAFRQRHFELGFDLCDHAREAYRAARYARFEHGESGAPITPVEGLKRFVESQCVRGADQEVRLPTFRSAYAAWCDARKVTVVGTKELTTELRRFGVTLSRGRRPRVYLGLSLR